jgi:hypothetical protein
MEGIVFVKRNWKDFSSVRRQERTNCYGNDSQHMIVHVPTSNEFFASICFPFKKYINLEESDSIYWGQKR